MFVIVAHNTEHSTVFTTNSLDKAFILCHGYITDWIANEITEEDIKDDKWKYHNGTLTKTFYAEDGLDLTIQIFHPSKIKENNNYMNRNVKKLKKELNLSKDKKLHNPIYIKNPNITDTFDMTVPQYIELDINKTDFKKLK